MIQIAINKTKRYLKVKYKLSYIQMLKCKGHCEE